MALVAPAIVLQIVPSAEDCHWKLMLLPKPPQVPAVPVSVSPRCALPLTVGRVWLTGPAASTGVVGSLASTIVPSGLVAVTTTRTSASTSAAVSR